MHIVLKIVQGIYLIRDVFCYLPVMLDQFGKRIGREIISRHHIQKLTERESPQIIRDNLSGQIRILFLQAHDRRTGKDYAQIGEMIITIPQLF